MGAHLLNAETVLIVEEIDAFLEGNVKEVAATLKAGRTWTFLGKGTGHLNPFDELNPDRVIGAIAKALGTSYGGRTPEYDKKAAEIALRHVMPRGLQFCPGCPHRATYWSIKDALRLDGRGGVLAGDIGCYAMGLTPAGYSQVKITHAMGSGAGVACGLGKLAQFGFNQPVLAVCGDSTFYHAVVPALMNSVHNRSDFALILLDNAATGMTGFQPHPGIARDAAGNPAPKIDPLAICEALGVPVTVTDPYDVEETREKVLQVINAGGGPRVLISRRECALVRTGRGAGPLFRVSVDPDKCAGEACGCNRYCTRVFMCPGLIWERNGRKAEIDRAICNGCGVCVHVCPNGAITREALS